MKIKNFAGSCWAIAALLTAPLANSASANPTVTVVNTPGNPVPVTGQVSIGNSVLPVEVRNADPIPVTIGNSGVRFQTETLMPIAPGTTGDTKALFVVPAGKTAIVKFVSGRTATTPDSWVSCSVTQMVGDSPFGPEQQVLMQKQPRIGVDYWHQFSQEMEFYVEGGRGAGFTCLVAPAPVRVNEVIFKLTMTGVLVDAQQ